MAKRLIACLVVILVLAFSCPAVFAQDEDLPPPPSEIPEQYEDEDFELPPAPPVGPGESEPLVIEPPIQDEEAPPVETAAPAPVPGKNWPMFKCDAAHTGYTEERLTFPLKLAWKYVTEPSANNPSSPAVADGVVYFCSGRRLYAVNAETGSLKWRYPAEESLTATIKSSPLVGDDLVYFGGGDGRLYAITKDTGTQAWSFTTKGIMNCSPILSDGVIYVGSSDDHLYALDARTGQAKWPGGFRTLDDVSCSPAEAGGLIYFISNDMVIYAAHTATGKVKWSLRAGAVSRATTPVVSGNTVYVAAGNVIQAYQAKSGRLIWGVPLSSEITTVPAVVGGSVYLGAKNGKLYAFTSAGKLKWKAPVDLGTPIYGSPIVAGDVVIVGADRGVLAAVDTETGALVWKYTVFPTYFAGGRLKYVNVSAAPVVSGGTVYALADDGTLHAFRNDAPDKTPPHVSMVVPVRDSLMPGAPPIEIAAVVADPGSGINADTISMLLDGEPVEHKLITERGIIWYKTPITQPVSPLSDGVHTVTLSVCDWAGNKSETNWSFTVDNRIRKAPKPAQTQPTAPGTTPPGAPRPPGMPPGTGSPGYM